MVNLLGLLLIKPFRDHRDNLLNIINEVVYTGVCSLCWMFLKDPSDYFGQIIIYLVTANISILTIIIAFLFIVDLSKAIYSKLCKKKVGAENSTVVENIERKRNPFSDSDIEVSPIEEGFQSNKNMTLSKEYSTDQTLSNTMRKLNF